MSRIRGIEARIQKDTLEEQKHNEVSRNTAENQSQSKDDAEKKQINELLYKLPKLDKIFDVHRKIGEGTFSSVYLGSLKQHAHLSDTEKKWFAIKHLVPTAHPARIEHELRCLQDIGGKNHVIGVELCLRHMDTIVFVMPYVPHRKFSEYVGDMDAAELQRYMRALLTALQHVHSFGVIHRDVKPSNFLYDRENQRYLLVDFGLAQRICPAPEEEIPSPPPAHSNTVRKRVREEDDLGPESKRVALDLTIGAKATKDTDDVELSVPINTQVQVSESGQTPLTIKADGGGAADRTGAARCACAGLGGVCGWCAARAGPRAPRAGTQGFRPPEVLLKVTRQTTAVDVWAAGVVLASALTRRYPFFRAPDDGAALAELADLLGTEPLQQAARALGRRIVTSSVRRGLCLRKLCARLRGAGHEVAGAERPTGAKPCTACHLAAARCVCRDDTKKAEEWSAGVWVCGFPDSAFALAARLLQPLPAARPSAARALRHPFLLDAL